MNKKREWDYDCLLFVCRNVFSRTNEQPKAERQVGVPQALAVPIPLFLGESKASLGRPDSGELEVCPVWSDCAMFFEYWCKRNKKECNNTMSFLLRRRSLYHITSSTPSTGTSRGLQKLRVQGFRPAPAQYQRIFINLDPGLGVLSDDAAKLPKAEVKGNVISLAEVVIQVTECRMRAEVSIFLRGRSYIRVCQRNRTNRIYGQNLLWTLAHMIMEAKICHDLLSESWRTRRANDVIHCQQETPRTRSSDVQGQEEMDFPTQGKREFSLPPLLFYLGPQ